MEFRLKAYPWSKTRSVPMCTLSTAPSVTANLNAVATVKTLTTATFRLTTSFPSTHNTYPPKSQHLVSLQARVHHSQSCYYSLLPMSRIYLLTICRRLQVDCKGSM